MQIQFIMIELKSPATKLKLLLLKFLKAEGFIKDFKVIADSKQNVIKVSLKYGANKEKVISGIKRISKTRSESLLSKDQLPRVLGGLGIALISTSQGLMTDKSRS